MLVNHTLKPVYNKDSKVLILGSIPSIKSRELNFYYMHPQNRFYKTLGQIFNEEVGESIKERKEFVLRHHIALFDVIKSCEITSSSDSTIKNIVPNDLSEILHNANIKKIFTTGKKAYQLYNKYCYPHTKVEAFYLPSTSPANCPKGIEDKLYQSYSVIKKYLDD